MGQMVHVPGYVRAGRQVKPHDRYDPRVPASTNDGRYLPVLWRPPASPATRRPQRARPSQPRRQSGTQAPKAQPTTRRPRPRVAPVATLSRDQYHHARAEALRRGERIEVTVRRWDAYLRGEIGAKGHRVNANRIRPRSSLAGLDGVSAAAVRASRASIRAPGRGTRTTIQHHVAIVQATRPRRAASWAATATAKRRRRWARRHPRLSTTGRLVGQFFRPVGRGVQEWRYQLRYGAR